MMYLINIVLLVGIVLIPGSESMPTMPSGSPMDMDKAMGYLKHYGYLGEKMPMEEYRKMAETDMDSAVTMAFKFFQERYHRYGLKITGQPDMETMMLMNKSRCGNEDIMTAGDMMKRKKRYNIFGSSYKWPTNDVKYKISQYPRDNEMSRSDIDYEIMRAFAVWEAVSPLHFTKVPANSEAEIDIKFFQPYERHSSHDQGFHDGAGGTLAHAYAPTNGDTHFDEAETFTLNTDRGINLFQVAAHEFGHALGLSHSEDPQALMAPFYAGYLPSFMLPEDDRRGIQSLYGPPIQTTRRTTTTKPTTIKPTTTKPTTRRPNPTRRPKPTIRPRKTTRIPRTTPSTFPPGMNDICSNPKFDAITTLTSKGQYKTYGFQGDQYFQLDNNGIVSSYPRKIKEGWPGLPDNIDAALFWDAVYEEKWEFNRTSWQWDRVREQVQPSATFVFKGSQYWRVEDMSVPNGYPRATSDEWGIPSNIDAAFVWEPNGKTYFIKGDEYYRYTENVGVDHGYPRKLSAWGYLPTNIDTVIPGRNGQTYFFSGDQFYVYDNDKYKVVETKYIEPHWLKCSTFVDIFVSSATTCETSVFLPCILAALCLITSRLI